MTVMALADPSGNIEVVDGILHGRITIESLGTAGFGYDPVFWVSEMGQTLAELTFDQKNRISHRAQALQKMKTLLERKISHTVLSGRSAAR